MDASLKILESVNNLYSQSFSQLINITIAVLAFSSVVLPIVVTLYQKRLFKVEHQKIKGELWLEMQQELKEQLTIIKNEIKHEYSEKEQKLEQEIKRLKTELKRDMDSLNGGVLMVQGSNQLKNGAYVSAVHSLFSAINSFINSNDNLNLQRAIKITIEDCLPQLTSNILEDHTDITDIVKQTLSSLKKFNNNRAYTDHLRSLERGFKKAQQRQDSKPAAA
ncbi:MAG: hypothetical protein ACPGUD_05580 [Parashewanella sp.]